MRAILVGEVRTADFVLDGMLRAGTPPIAILTTRRDVVLSRTAMHRDYYADLAPRARELGVPLIHVEDLSLAADELGALTPDVLLIMGWPYLVRAPILDLAPCIGMHPTRLPLRRGGAPLNWMILDGETRGAVTLLRLRAGVDDGDILAQREFPIGPDDYVGDLADRVYAITEDLVADSMTALKYGTAVWIPQNDALATYTRRRVPDDGRIAWRDSTMRIRNLIRAVSRPYPGAFSELGDQRWIIWRADVPVGYRAPLKAAPGTVLDVSPRGVLVGTLDNALLVTEATIGTGDVLRGDALAAAAASWLGRVFD